MKPTPLSFLEDFLLHIQTNNYSPETLYNYEKDLKVFELFLLNDVNLPFHKITKKTIDQYKAYLVSRDRKTSSGKASEKILDAGSINRHLSSLRRYLKYLIDVDEPTPLSPEAITLMRAPKKIPRVAEFADLVKLIEAPTHLEQEKILQLRNRAMLELIFSTGMRISELVNLKRSQIDGSGKIFILGKGKKQRFVYLTPRAKEHLDQYLQLRVDDNPHLFIPTRGRNANQAKKRISTNYLQEKIKKYREILQINVPTSAHSLRHGFATYLAERGAGAPAIQMLLGHASLNTTTRYVHPSDRLAESSHRKYHPLRKASTDHAAGEREEDGFAEKG